MVRTLPPLPSLTDQNSLSLLASSHRFSDYANWLVPGAVMQGGHPASVPESAAKRIQSIVSEAGCRTFVCLQGEAPPQDESLRSCGGCDEWKTNPKKFHSYRSDVMTAAASANDDGVSVGGPPTFLHYGLRDGEAAESIESLAQFVDNLALRVKTGETLYIHCWGGKGRAGLVSTCLLAELYDIDAEDALERTNVYCNLRDPGGKPVHSPETEAQKDQVRELIKLRRHSKK